MSPAALAIDQRDGTFVPCAQLLRTGDKVVFRNQFIWRPGNCAPPIAIDKVGIAA